MAHVQKLAWRTDLLSPQVLITLQLLKLAAPKPSDDFSGLGIVFYDSLAALPFLPLEVAGSESFDLPVCGLGAISEVLTRTARPSSQWHDGFHFVQTGSVCLTHLCQFIAPPIPDTDNALPRASGARHMTALLASRVSGIVNVGLLTQEREVTIYESGALKFDEVLS